MYSRIKTHALRNPEDIALIDAERHLTFLEYFQRAETLAKHFQEAGLAKERIALHLPNSCELAIAYLACFMSGVIALPLHTTLTESEIHYILENTSPKWIVSDTLKKPHSARLLRSSDLFKLSEELSSHSLDTPLADDPIAIFYTSGSTAKPKGVMHSNRSMSATLKTLVEAGDLTKSDRFLVSESMTNMSGCTHLFLGMVQGGSSILIPIFTIRHFLQSLRFHPTIICVMGEGNALIVQSNEIHPKLLQGIRYNFSGGAMITKELMKSFKEKTGFPIRYSYGMSEFLLFTVNKSADPQKLGSVGTKAEGVSIRLLDSNQNQVRKGEAGELWAKADNCMLGYWNNPEESQKAIVDGWLRTGDLVRLDQDGYYWFVGRLKQIIVRAGDNLSPLEIEGVLERHPAVHCAAVIGIPDPLEGEVPLAYVELIEGQSAKKEELFAFLRTHLEEDKIPVDIRFEKRLPRTRTGKISKNSLNPNLP